MFFGKVKGLENKNYFIGGRKMKKLILSTLVLLVFITGCGNKNQNSNISHINSISNESEDGGTVTEFDANIKININGKSYNAVLDDNDTAAAFAEKLPQSFNMSELNGNEKYIYLNYSLPVNSYDPKQILAGDIMLYGDNCLVIFYKTFSTRYSYTKIGHIEGLADLGNGNITAYFEK